MKNPLLHYKTYAKKEQANSIVLLHGMLGNMDNWRRQAQRLSKHFHVITPDLRNHGRSPHLSGMRYKDMASDVLALVEHLEINSFHLLGHSMGGKIAMEIALNHPQNIQKLMIIDIAPKAYQLWHLATFKALLALPVDQLTSRTQADKLLSEEIDDPFDRAFLLKNLKSNQSGGYSWRCNLEEITRAYLNISNFTQKEQAKFEGDVLFIKGEKSPYINIDQDTDVISNFFPKSDIKTVLNSGHNPHTENAEAFYVMISHFLDLD